MARYATPLMKNNTRAQHSMQGEGKEGWLQFWEQAANEQVPKDSSHGSPEINRLPEAKDERLKKLRNPPTIDSAD